jgi:hypothetical protein
MTVTHITQRPAATDHAIGAIEAALAQGDLSKLSPEDRTRYLLRVCESRSALAMRCWPTISSAMPACGHHCST